MEEMITTIALWIGYAVLFSLGVCLAFACMAFITDALNYLCVKKYKIGGRWFYIGRNWCRFQNEKRIYFR